MVWRSLSSFPLVLILAFSPVTSRTVRAAEPGPWIELLPATGAESIWTRVDSRWIHAEDAGLDADNPRKLKAKGSNGNAWVNGPGRLADLITKKAYTDIEVHVEFMLGKQSNAGIKFHAVYEIQLQDTAAKQGRLTGDDCGGIYPMALDFIGYRQIDSGIPPLVNAARPAGEWQTLDVHFRSPQFDSSGKKTRYAEIVYAKLNGQLIHKNVMMKYPTGTNWEAKEKPSGPFMLQSDHGPTAYRNVKLREMK